MMEELIQEKDARERVIQGKIIKGIAGFYYVHGADGQTYECKAKGVFRRDNVKPLVGDDVDITILEGERSGSNVPKGNIISILPRRSRLIRPAVANVDQAVVIFALAKPEPNLNLLDRFLIMMEQEDIPCVICFNKADIDVEGHFEEYLDIYRKAGYRALCVSARNKEGLEGLQEILRGHTTTVAGPSGVGKSSIINCLQSGVSMETGAISRKIERGRHTTRHSELIAIDRETYILDTPGFASLGVFDIEKEALASYFPELAAREAECRFVGCAHVEEPDCAVKHALEQGEISYARYRNYLQIYGELKDKRKRR